MFFGELRSKICRQRQRKRHRQQLRQQQWEEECERATKREKKTYRIRIRKCVHTTSFLCQLRMLHVNANFSQIASIHTAFTLFSFECWELCTTLHSTPLDSTPLHAIQSLTHSLIWFACKYIIFGKFQKWKTLILVLFWHFLISNLAFVRYSLSLVLRIICIKSRSTIKSSNYEGAWAHTQIPLSRCCRRCRINRWWKLRAVFL